LLRSFEQEQLKLATSLFYSTRIEEVVVSSIKRFGPVIAIGSPEDELPQLGAARAYVPRNDEWTRIALEWIHSARMIVLFAGRTTGLLWELGRIIQHGYLNKTIVLCSHNSASDRQIWHNNSEADGSYLFAVQIADAIGRGDVITQSNLDDVIAMFVGRHQELVFVRTPNFSADAYEKAIEQWVLEVFCTQRECAPPH
jgi:hypothetical protein